MVITNVVLCGNYLSLNLLVLRLAISSTCGTLFECDCAVSVICLVSCGVLCVLG